MDLECLLVNLERDIEEGSSTSKLSVAANKHYGGDAVFCKADEACGVGVEDVMSGVCADEDVDALAKDCSC